MNAEQFAYWMQGFVELSGAEPTPEQWKSIKDHLQLVFKKVTPIDYGVFRHEPLRPAAPGPGQTFIPTPLYEPRITCDIRPGEQPPQNEKAWNLTVSSAQDFKNRGH